MRHAAADALVALREAVVDAVVARQYAPDPGLVQRYGAAGRGKCREDARAHL